MNFSDECPHHGVESVLKAVQLYGFEYQLLTPENNRFQINHKGFVNDARSGCGNNLASVGVLEAKSIPEILTPLDYAVLCGQTGMEFITSKDENYYYGGVCYVPVIEGIDDEGNLLICSVYQLTHLCSVDDPKFINKTHYNVPSLAYHRFLDRIVVEGIMGVEYANELLKDQENNGYENFIALFVEIVKAYQTHFPEKVPELISFFNHYLLVAELTFLGIETDA